MPPLQGQIQDRGLDLVRPADETQVPLAAIRAHDQFARAHQAAVAAAKSQRGLLQVFEFRHPLLVHEAREHHHGHIARGGVGYAQALVKLRGDAHAFESARQHLAAAMHHHHGMAGAMNRRDLPRQILAALGVFRALPADFDDQLHALNLNLKSQI